MRKENPYRMSDRQDQHPDKTDLLRMIGPVIAYGKARYIYQKEEGKNYKKQKYPHPGSRYTNKMRYIFPAEIRYSRCPYNQIHKCIAEGNEHSGRYYLQHNLKNDYGADIKSE